MKRVRKYGLGKIELFVLSVAMLIVTPGAAVQMNRSHEIATMAGVQTITAPQKETARQRVRDCSLGIPCRRVIASNRIKPDKVAMLAVIMSLGAQAKIR